jgi:hypothetical protein
MSKPKRLPSLPVLLSIPVFNQRLLSVCGAGSAITGLRSLADEIPRTASRGE